MRSFIMGTDWWTDCDDAVALRLMARAHISGQVKLLGVGINACMEDSVASLYGFLIKEGIRVPIGIDRAATDFGGNPPYQKRLAEDCPVRVENADAEDAAEMYIRLLSESVDPVEIIEIGFPQVLADVCDRAPALFSKKVKHVWMMAGKWDENPGREHNFEKNARSRNGAARFLTFCPCPITFLGYEAADCILTGGNLLFGDQLKQVLIDHGHPDGRSSWDPMLTELAIGGDISAAGYREVRGTASVEESTGLNYFVPDEKGKHRYVVKTLPDEIYRDRINEKIKTL